MVGKLLLAGVARDQGEEMGSATIPLGPENAPESLRLLLARAECTRHLDEHVGVWQIDSEVADLREHDAVKIASPEAIVDALALRLRGLAGHEGRRDLLGDVPT